MDWLLNWAVHGSSLTLIVGAGLCGGRRMNAATRERILWITLAAVTAMPAVSSLWITAGATAAWPSLVGPDPLLAMPPLPTTVVIVAAVWGAGAAIRMARLVRDLLRVTSARRRAIPFPPDREARLERWAQSHRRGRRAQLVLSPLVHHAAVLGFRNPVIALAPDTVARLSDRELDQVVAHEHAHVRRRDDVAALVQKVIASVLWWHPAVWWLDRALTIEREVACDDWVIVERDATKSYGTCLVKLASLSREHRTSITPAFLLSRSELETRIARLIDRGRNASVRPSQVALSVAAPGVMGLALACATVAVFGPSAIVLPAIPLPGPGVVVLDSLPAWPIADVLALPATPRSRAASGQRVQVGSGELSPIDHAAPAARLVQGFQHDEYSLTGEPPPLDLEQMAGVLPPAALPPRPSTPPVAAPTPAPRPDDPVTVGTSNPRWSVFATGGVAAGRGAQDAAVSTARFFSQFGKSIGTAFRPGSPGRAAEP